MISSSDYEVASPLTPELFLNLGFQFAQSKIFLTAVELQLFTVIAKDGPMDVQALQKKLDLHERGARDFFDALVSMKVS